MSYVVVNFLNVSVSRLIISVGEKRDFLSNCIAIDYS